MAIENFSIGLCAIISVRDTPEAILRQTSNNVPVLRIYDRIDVLVAILIEWIVDLGAFSRESDFTFVTHIRCHDLSIPCLPWEVSAKQ